MFCWGKPKEIFQEVFEGKDSKHETDEWRNELHVTVCFKLNHQFVWEWEFQYSSQNLERRSKKWTVRFLPSKPKISKWKNKFKWYDEKYLLVFNFSRKL